MENLNEVLPKKHKILSQDGSTLVHTDSLDEAMQYWEVAQPGTVWERDGVIVDTK